MNPFFNKFIDLLWCGAGLKEPGAIDTLPSDDEEWYSVFECSVNQCVCGIVYTAVEALPEENRPCKALLDLWRSATEQIERNSAYVLALAEKQRLAWEKHGINAVLLKGPESAKMYSRPERRTTGDLDWWMPSESDWKAALKVLENNSLQWERDSDGDIRYLLGDTPVEHHVRGLEAPGAEGVLLMLASHILHHALVFGVGFKQVCDYFVALNYFEGRYDDAGYEALLKKKGILRWERRLRAMDPVFLSFVFEDGNMGRAGKRNPFSAVRRFVYFAGLCPGALFARWTGLVFGRLKRIF